MSIEYQNRPIDWDNAGVTPPQDLIEKGFQPGYKPPAEYFNALLHATSEAIKELQEKTVELSNTVDAGAGGATEHTDNAAPHITDAACTYSNSIYTLTPNKEIESANYFCLRFKAPNNYVTSASFKIGTKTYTAVNAAFKQNDIVILNFDVSQSKCFFVSGGTTYGVATTASNGLMSAADKTKLDDLSNKSAGQKVEGQTFYIDGTSVTAGTGAEIFNKYDGETKATGRYSVAMGYGSIAKGYCSVAMGYGSIAAGDYSISIGNGTIANEANTAIGSLNKTPTAGGATYKTGDVFIIGNGTNATKSNAFRVTMAGDVMGAKEYLASGADYAEMFEWADGNPDNEDRRGLFVTLDGEKIRPASADDDYILGVVSATPSVVADAQTDDWGKKWKTDVFGERLFDENGAWILNKDFREEDNESYVSRLDRKEWAAVGLVGKLIIVDDGTCEVNGYCSPANGGTATKSETGYRVLSRIDESHIKVLVK